MKNRNENRPGYTKTTLGKVADIYSGGTPSRAKPEYWDGNIPWVKTTQIQDNTISEADIDEWITDEGLKHSSAKMVSKGTILMAMYGQGKTRGRVAILGLNATINQACAAISLKSGTDRGFIFQQLRSCYDVIRRMSNSGGQDNLSAGLIKGIKLKLPPLAEQEKIAEVLGCWDKGIGRLEDLIEQKRLRKKGLMQQLLTGEKRLPGFSEGWKEVHLGDVVKSELRAKYKPSEPFLSAGIRSHGKGVFLKPNFEPQSIDIDKLYELKEDDLVVNITFAWEGAIAVVQKEADGALVSHRFPTYRADEKICSIDYLKFLIMQQRFKFDCVLASPGGAGRNRVLNKKVFLKIRLTLPPLKEQEVIATVLRTADEEIELLEDELDALREQKKGLMQKLLAGEVRHPDFV